MDNDCQICKGYGVLYDIDGRHACVCPECDGTGKKEDSQ